MGKHRSENIPRKNKVTINSISDYDQATTLSGDQYAKCPDKRTYDNIQEAEFVASRNSNKSGRKIDIYQCPICGYYHLTSSARLE